MKEYIERAEAINAIRQYQYPYGVEFLLANIPAADVVEVVRCRECVYATRPGDNIVYCDNFERDMMPDDYCSVGERKEDEHGD